MSWLRLQGMDMDAKRGATDPTEIWGTMEILEEDNCGIRAVARPELNQ